MKKIFNIILCAFLLIILTGCNKNEESFNLELDKTYEYAETNSGVKITLKSDMTVEQSSWFEESELYQERGTFKIDNDNLTIIITEYYELGEGWTKYPNETEYQFKINSNSSFIYENNNIEYTYEIVE